jgi:drug/metabolite transporter (DMT)-like permease
MNVNNNIFGIIYILIAMALFSVHDAILKYIFEKTSLYEVFFARTLIAAFLSGGFLLITKQRISLITHYPLLSIIRVVLHFLAFSFYFVSLTYLSLAVATALYFSTPFFMSIFARIFLKEHIGYKRWLSIFFGFIGVYIILNPNFEDFDYKTLLPLLCALFYALSMTITKITSDKDDAYTQLLYFYLITILLCVLLFLILGSGQFDKYSDPTVNFIFREWFSDINYTWKFISIIGVLATVAFTCVFKAYSSYSTSVSSIFEYSLIVWSIIIGSFLFNDIPTIRTIIGCIIVIFAGMFIFFREKIREQKTNLETPLRR